MIKRNILDCMKLVGEAPSYYENEKTYVSTGAVDCDHIDYTQSEKVKYENRPSRANLSVNEGDILFAKMCGTKKTLLVDKTMSNCLFSTGFYAVRANESVITTQLLYYLLSSYQFLSQRDQNSSGATQKAITNSGLKKINVSVPDLKEQFDIVKRLNCIDQMIAKQHEQLCFLDQLVKSRFIELFGNEIYHTSILIDIIKPGAGLSYGIVQPGDDGTGDMGVLRPVDIVGEKISTDSIKYIDRTIGDRFKKTELTGHELLITVRGTTGITALTDDRFVGMNVTRGIAVVKYDRQKVNPFYLNAYLKSDKSQRYIQEHTRGATLQQINLSDLRVQEILIPPMGLQNQFADFVKQVDKSKLYCEMEAVA